jgi:hypothetical protein
MHSQGKDAPVNESSCFLHSCSLSCSRVHRQRCRAPELTGHRVASSDSWYDGLQCGGIGSLALLHAMLPCQCDKSHDGG